MISKVIDFFAVWKRFLKGTRITGMQKRLSAHQISILSCWNVEMKSISLHEKLLGGEQLPCRNLPCLKVHGINHCFHEQEKALQEQNQNLEKQVRNQPSVANVGAVSGARFSSVT
ncbi:hypothetical protein BHM03_00060776 [Ensete ventricosum]|nr:hypothetical protein BHM03_00060776 [Ensete ventricosum]